MKVMDWEIVSELAKSSIHSLKMRLIHHVVVDHKFTKNDAGTEETILFWVGRLINFKNICFQTLPAMYLKKNFSVEIYQLVIFYHEK